MDGRETEALRTVREGMNARKRLTTKHALLTALLLVPLAGLQAADTSSRLTEPAFPRILIHNFLTELDSPAVEALAKRDVVVMAPWFRNHLDVVRQIRKLNPQIIILMYATLDSAYYTDTHKQWDGRTWGIGNKDEARQFSGHPEVWLYECPAGQLAADLSPDVRDVLIHGLDSARLRESFGANKRKPKNVSPKPVLAIGDELVRVEAMDGERLTLRRGQCGTKPSRHPAGATVRWINQCSWANAVQRGGPPDAELLRINLSDLAPAVGGRKPWQIKADFYLKTYWQDPAWRSCFDGFFFDNGHEWQTLDALALDLDGDGQPDGNAFASLEKGVRSFFAYLRQQGGPELLMTPNNISELLPMVNGRHREYFVGKVDVREFTQRDSGQWQFSVWEFSMEPYRAYQAAGAPPPLAMNSTQPGAWNDYRAVRFGLGSALLLDGCFQFRQLSGDHGNWQSWYDEFSVDATGAATDGRVGRHWLGKPLGEARQIVQTLNSANLLAGAQWSLRTNRGSVARFSAIDSTLRMETTSLPDCRPENVELTTPIAAGLRTGDTATLSLEMRASVPRLIQFALAGSGVPPIRSKVVAPLFVSTNWTRRVFSFTFRDERPMKGYPLSFSVGDDLGTVELRNVSWQMGGAVTGWLREFEHGLVVVNPTLQPQEFAVSGNFKRVRGTQDAAHNNGQPVSGTIAVPPCDAYLLIRTP